MWEVRLWENEPSKRYAILFAASIAALLGWALMRNPVSAIFGFGAIVISTAEYWLPQKFKIDETGASRKCGPSLTVMEWPNVKHVLTDNQGVRLLPVSPDSRLSPFRGVYLRFAENRDEVLRLVQEKVPSE